MILNIELKDQIRIHALETQPSECCGFVIQLNNSINKVYIKANNMSSTEDTFIIDPADYQRAEDMGTILAIVHSHVYTSSNMSSYDKAAYNLGDTPWIIYSYRDNCFSEYDTPKGEIPPLLGRQFFFGIQDCYSIIQDYYKSNLGISLPNAIREDKFWHKGQNLYLDNYTKAGFVLVPLADIRIHDVVLMKLGITSIPNHGAVYIEDNYIIHHIQNRLSEKTLYIQKWRDNTTHILRHTSLL